MSKSPKTGEKQAKAGKNGNVPPASRRFGAPNGNPINKKGRNVNSFSKLRKLAQEIGNETIDDKETVTRFMALLRLMSSSRNPTDRANYLAYAVGKPKDEVEHTGTGEDGALIHKVIFVDDTDGDYQTPKAAPVTGDGK